MAAISRGGCNFPCVPTIPASQAKSIHDRQQDQGDRHRAAAPPAPHRHRLDVRAVALFACLDTTAKYLNTHMDAMQITWARYTSAFVLTLFVSNPFTHTGLLR